MIIISFGHCHGNWVVNKVEQYEIVLFPILGTYALSMDWVDFWLGEWHEICVIHYKVLG